MKNNAFCVILKKEERIEAEVKIVHESGEMYLESIYVLSKKSDSVRSIDICDYMGYSKPSVSRAVGLLKKDGHITVDGKGYIFLTESGLKIAEAIFERHTIIMNTLLSLGIDEETADNDACKIEHVISDKTFKAIKEHYQKNK